MTPGRRFATVATLVTFVAGAGLLMEALVFRPIGDREKEATALREELSGVRQRRLAVERELAALRQAASHVPKVGAYASADTATTAALVQERFRTLTDEVGGTLLSSQAAGEQAISDGLTRLQVMVRVRLSEEGLFRLLAGLDAAQPPLMLAAFEVSLGPALADQPPLDFAGVVVAFHADAS
jgi:hypothetical protein